MGTISYTIPSAGSTLNSIADPEVATALQTLLTWANGNIDAVNLSAALAQAAGVNQSGQTMKGAVNIAASESRTNVAYGTLTTPDQVTGVVLPTNGLIAVWYQAMWQESVAGAAAAAIFLGGNQLAVQSDQASFPGTQQARISGGIAAVNRPLFSLPIGLASVSSAGGGWTADVTTGQAVGVANSAALTWAIGGTSESQTGGAAVGGPCYIFAAAGTYTVSIQFKASSGSVTASGRKLWVQAVPFS